MKEGDAEAVFALAEAAKSAAQWRIEEYRALGGRVAGWVAETEMGLCGFILGRAAADEAEILNLAVAENRRREKIASRLLDKALGEWKKMGAEKTFLEVRESNQPGRKFYEGQGFRVSGRRKMYYADPKEDALVLVREK